MIFYFILIFIFYFYNILILIYLKDLYLFIKIIYKIYTKISIIYINYSLTKKHIEIIQNNKNKKIYIFKSISPIIWQCPPFFVSN